MKTPKQDPKTITVTAFGKSWFNNFNGNNFHIVKVIFLYANGDTVELVSRVKAGYKFVSSVIELLNSYPIPVPENIAAMVNTTIDVVDVPRKSALTF